MVTKLLPFLLTFRPAKGTLPARLPANWRQRHLDALDILVAQQPTLARALLDLTAALARRSTRPQR